MIKAIGKITPAPKGRTLILYIPSLLAVDSAFPFKAPESVVVRIDGEKLIIERVKT